MMSSYWRERARPIVAEVLRATKGKPEKEVRKALRDAYPFGPRSHHPYKIWLDEVHRQRGTGKHARNTNAHRPAPELQERIAQIRAHNAKVAGDDEVG